MSIVRTQEDQLRDKEAIDDLIRIAKEHLHVTVESAKYDKSIEHHTLKDVFDVHLAHVKFDNKLAKALYQYQIGYINRNHEHLEFFGSNLLGVHVVRYKDSDVLKMYNDILDVDYQDLTEDIRKVDTINHEFKVSGDVFNLTMMYLIHKFLTSDLLDEKTSQRAAYDVGLIFFYRCIAAILSYYFRYPADPKIAQAAYANLTNKFLIKKLGSWHKVMDYRASDLVDKSGIHYKNLLTFTNDLATVYAINDAQGRIRDLIKNYYAEFIKVHAQGNNIAVTSGTYFDAEGEETIKEKTKSVEQYVTYMKNTIIDKPTFVKDELVSIIVSINTNTSFRMVKSTLNWLCDHYNEGKLHKEIDSFMGTVIVQSLYMIQNNMESKHLRDYPYILTTLKNLYLSTRTSDKDIDKIRKEGSYLINRANPGISESLVLATRTSIILYLTLRALIGQSAK